MGAVTERTAKALSGRVWSTESDLRLGVQKVVGGSGKDNVDLVSRRRRT